MLWIEGLGRAQGRLIVGGRLAMRATCGRLPGGFWGEAQDEHGVFGLGGVVDESRQRGVFGAGVSARSSSA